MPEVESSLAEKLALACHILATGGHSDQIFGHVTAREPYQSYLYIIPAGISLEEASADDIIVIDLEGNILAGSGRRPSEYPIHTEIYKMYPNINSVIHTHPFYSIIVGATMGMIKPVSHEGVLFTDVHVFTETTELIRTSADGQAVARALNGKQVLLLRNHGVVVTGDSIEQATVYALLLEKAAKIQIIAHLLGSYNFSPQEEIPHKIEQCYSDEIIKSLWNYYVRKLTGA